MLTKKQEADDKIEEDPAPNDPPPTYSPPEASGSGSGSGSGGTRAPTNARPSNFTAISQRSGAIRGSWAIDPSLVIPASVLPPLPEGDTEATRKNLLLETKDGRIEADITLVKCSIPDNEKSRHKRVLIHVRTSNKKILVNLHDEASGDLSNPRRPVRLTTYNSDGSIHLQLPRSFRGPVVLKLRDGKVHFSEGVQARITTFSADKRTHSCFLGEFAADESAGGEGWMGDEVEAETKDGSIHVRFDDEPEPAPKGFFKKVFGS